MRLMLIRSLVCSLLMLPALVVAQETAEAEASPDVTATAEVTTPTETPVAVKGSAGLIGAAPDGKGQIVFFRPSKMVGAAIGFKVREGETELGKLRNGRYFVASVEPGTHEYVVHSETQDVLTIEVEAGETYYVQGTLGMGIVTGRPNLSPSDEGTFNGLSTKLKMAN